MNDVAAVNTQFKTDERTRRLTRIRVRRHRAKKKAEREARLAQPEVVAAQRDADAFLEWWSGLRVPNGNLAGQLFHIAPWQENFVRACLSPEIKLAGMSIARKNLKTTTCAAWALGHLGGPLRRPDWSAIACSLTGKNIGVLKRQMKAIYDANRQHFPVAIQFKETPQPGLVESAIGARVEFLAANRYSGGHSSLPSAVLVDEAGNFENRFVDLWGQLRTSLGGTSGTMIAISNRGDFKPFSDIERLKDRPHVHWVEFAADPDAKADDREQWLKANPALATGAKTYEYMQEVLDEASVNPSLMAIFRSLELNIPGRISNEPVVSIDDWSACEVPPRELPPRQGLAVCGVDVGGANSLTAFTVLWPETGRFEAFVACGDDPSLAMRGEHDSVGDAYIRMHERGELFLYPGRTTPVEAFIADIETIIGGAPIHIGFDRWRVDDVYAAMHRHAFNILGVHDRGVGAHAKADGSADIRAFQKAVRQGAFSTKFNTAMRKAIEISHIDRDTSGNPKLKKDRDRDRIDAMQAAVIAFGIAEKLRRQPEVKALSLGVVH